VYSTDIPWKMKIFLEGSILFKNHIYILTWQEHIVYKLNSTNLEIV